MDVTKVGVARDLNVRLREAVMVLEKDMNSYAEEGKWSKRRRFSQGPPEGRALTFC